MYSQYQQYQGGAAVVTQQQGMTWNGTQWIQTAAPVASTVMSSTRPSYASVTVGASAVQPSSLVALYTQYYHEWKKKETDEERKAQSLYGEAKLEATRQVAWAKYYADQASRAAHYFLNPTGAPPDLPPAPPSSPAAANPVVSRQVQSNTPQAPPKKESPGGLKRYVHNCLSRCKEKEALTKMQAEVQKVISQALKDGSMHTMDWDSKPLIPMPDEVLQHQPTFSSNSHGDASNYGMAAKPTTSVSYSLSNSHNDAGYHGTTRKPISSQSYPSSSYYGQVSETKSNDSYYGPSSTVQQKPSFSTIDTIVPNDSYYGNTSTSTTESKSIGGDYIIGTHKLSKKQKKRKPEAVGFLKSDDTLTKRASRFSGAGGLLDVSNSGTTVESGFDKYMGKGLIGGAKKLEETDYEMMTVKGTCQTLEKDYLRLTAPPKAELVRPQHVLEKHLQNLITERKDVKRRREYPWFCSQFKALRQDLTVQRIFNSFTIKVYETHARVALEERDVNEYNQCQTQLKELYDSLTTDETGTANRNEFIAYRLVYYVFLTGNKKYDGGSADLFNIMLSLTPEQRRDPSIAHALKVRSAVADFDYHAFFRLQNECPHVGMVFLMDFMVPTIRQWSLHRICKAYRPSVPVEFVLTELGFEKDEFEHGGKWLESCGCVLSKDRSILETKDCVVRESDWKEQNSLI